MAVSYSTRLFESTYAPAPSLPSHAHLNATVSLVRRGSLVEVLGRRSHQCKPFDLIVEPPGETHTDQIGPDGATCFHIVIDSHRLDSLHDFSDVFTRPGHARGGSLPALTTRLGSELSLRDSASLLAIESLVFEVLAQTMRLTSSETDAGPPYWLRHARDLIRSELTRDLRLRSVAARVGVHPGHLARAFRKHYQCSVGGYLRKARVEAAIQMIARSNAPLIEIATSV
jgi:AraC family transcriptional regulator